MSSIMFSSPVSSFPVKNFLIFSQYLSQDREMEDHEEVELLLEGYRSDFQEIQLELRSMRLQIDDTR